MDPTVSERDALLFAQQADQVLAQLRERLAPADYQLVLQLRQLEEYAAVAACTAAEQHTLAAVIACLPDSALASLGEVAAGVLVPVGREQPRPRRRARQDGLGLGWRRLHWRRSRPQPPCLRRRP